MKVRVEYSLEASPHLRRLIRRYWGKKGLADRSEIKHFFRMHGELGINKLAEK